MHAMPSETDLNIPPETCIKSPDKPALIPINPQFQTFYIIIPIQKIQNYKKNVLIN